MQTNFPNQKAQPLTGAGTFFVPKERSNPARRAGVLPIKLSMLILAMLPQTGLAQLGQTFANCERLYGTCDRDGEGKPTRHEKLAANSAQAEWTKGAIWTKIAWLAPEGAKGPADIVVWEASSGVLTKGQIQELLTTNSDNQNWNQKGNRYFRTDGARATVAEGMGKITIESHRLVSRNEPRTAATRPEVPVNQPYVPKTPATQNTTRMVVADISVTKTGITYINNARYPNQTMTVVIFAKDRLKFEQSLNGWKGKTIEISGEIKDYKGKPEIILNDPTQIIRVLQNGAQRSTQADWTPAKRLAPDDYDDYHD